MRSRKLRRRATALALWALGAWGCDLIQSAQADRMLAASLLSTPQKDLAQAILQADAGLTLPDAGAAGDAGGLTLTAQTVVQVFFGEAPQSSSSGPGKGVAGAAVTLEVGGASLALEDQGAGNYSLSSLDDARLAYQGGAQYRLSIALGSETYSAQVTAPSQDAPRIEGFEGTPLVQVDAGQRLQLTRSSTDSVAFTTVVPAGGGAPTYSDLPQKTEDLVDLILNDARWRQKVITVPGTAFPTAGAYYVVTVTAVDKGTVSRNLYTTSVFLAGTPDVGLVRAR